MARAVELNVASWIAIRLAGPPRRVSGADSLWRIGKVFLGGWTEAPVDWWRELVSDFW